MSWLSSLKAVFNPAPEINETEIQQVLQQYQMANHVPLMERVKQIQVEQTTLQLHIFIYSDEKDSLQALHDGLAEQLQKCGIQTLNLHVVEKKKKVDSQTEQSLQSTNADAQHYDPNNPPITQKAPTQQSVPAHPRIKQVIVVSSGKGGVGKSTTTVNLALALQQLGLKVGVLDADIYGPSIPTMLGNAGKTPQIEQEQFVPLEAYGMPTLSIGHLTGDDTTPIAWRGAKATGALMQMFNQTLWPDLDILVIDMPPGTGDIQLTLAQRIPVNGAVIVTTPQNIALLDAQKGIELFNKVSIPVLGVVENMSYHICSNCGAEEHIFGEAGGDDLAERYQVPMLGHIPLSLEIRKNVDEGKPSMIAGDEATEHYIEIAEQVLAQLQRLPKRERQDKRFF